MQISANSPKKTENFSEIRGNGTENYGIKRIYLVG